MPHCGSDNIEKGASLLGLSKIAHNILDLIIRERIMIGTSKIWLPQFIHNFKFLLYIAGFETSGRQLISSLLFTEEHQE